MKILLVVSLLIVAGVGGYAAQTIFLSQLSSQAFPGVMVNTGKGWVQAQIDSSLQINTGTNPPTLKASGLQGPVGPQGPQGTQGLQGVQGIQGPPGASAQQLPIIVLPDGTIEVKGISTDGSGPGTISFIKADGTSCSLAIVTGGGVICQ